MEPVQLGGDKTDDADRIIATIKMLEIVLVLIIVDTLNRTMIGNESSTEDMSRYIQRLDHVRREIGAHLMVIHHLGKDKDRGARGSSALPGAVDTGCMVDKVDDLTVLGPVIQRDMPEDFEQTFEARTVEIGLDDDAEPVTSLVMVPTDRKPNPEGKLSGPAKQALDVLWTEIKAGRGTPGGVDGPPIDARLHAIPMVSGGSFATKSH